NRTGVGVEAVRVATLEDRAGVDGLEPLWLDLQDLGVPVVGHPPRKTQAALEVEVPARDPLRVLADELALARRDRDLVHVVPGGIAVVEADVDRVRVLARLG